jgi:hypothetical protein
MVRDLKPKMFAALVLRANRARASICAKRCDVSVHTGSPHSWLQA